MQLTSYSRTSHSYWREYKTTWEYHRAGMGIFAIDAKKNCSGVAPSFSHCPKPNRKIRVYKYPHAVDHIHDSIPNYRNSVPFSVDGLDEWCEQVGPRDAEIFYGGQFDDKHLAMLRPGNFEFFEGNESRHVFDLEGDYCDNPIPTVFKRSMITAMNAGHDKRGWNLLVRPPCSTLLMDMVRHPRAAYRGKREGACFIGKHDFRGVRQVLYDALAHPDFAVHWEWTDKWNAMEGLDSEIVKHYEKEMSKWTMALCPPGEGEATVRYYEACGLGMMPIASAGEPKFMDDYTPPQLSPLEYFGLVIDYFNNPTLFFLRYFKLDEMLVNVEAA